MYVLFPQLLTHLLPSIMLRSASPSAAAPNSGGSTSEADLPKPIRATNSFAYVRLGSGWLPPKSSCKRNQGNIAYPSTNIKWFI